MPLTNTQYASIMRLYDDIKTANRRMQSDVITKSLPCALILPILILRLLTCL